jgi:hypothetical protein
MAITKQIFIDQGSTYSLSLTAQDLYGNVINIAGCTGYCHLRRSYFSSSYKEMNVSLTGGTGGYNISMGATSSAALKAGVYVYDVEFHRSDGTVVRVLQGNATVDPEVTKL